MKLTPEQKAAKTAQRRRKRTKEYLEDKHLGEKRFVPDHPWRRYANVYKRRR